MCVCVGGGGQGVEAWLGEPPGEIRTGQPRLYMGDGSQDCCRVAGSHTNAGTLMGGSGIAEDQHCLHLGRHMH